jgi:hypothetical protein
MLSDDGVSVVMVSLELTVISVTDVLVFAWLGLDPLFLFTPHLISSLCHLLLSASLRWSAVWLPCLMVGESSQAGTTLFECGMWTQESVCKSSKAMVG